MNRYRKTIVAVVGAGMSFATLVVTSAPEAVTAGEYLFGAASLLTALGVYAVSNDGPA